MSEQTYLGGGKWLIKELGAAEEYEELGVVSDASLAVEEQVIQMPNFTTQGGGNFKTVRRIQSAQLTMSLREYRPTVLSKLLRANLEAVASGSESDEPHTAYQGQVIRLLKGTTYTSVTVTGSGGTPSYTVGDDYVIRPMGIEIVSGGGIADATPLEISYSYVAVNLIKALVNTGKMYSLFFEGFNESQGGKAFMGEFFKTTLGAPQGMPFISVDDFASLPVSADIDRDTNRADDGSESQFFELTQVTA